MSCLPGEWERARSNSSSRKLWRLLGLADNKHLTRHPALMRTYDSACSKLQLILGQRTSAWHSRDG